MCTLRFARAWGWALLAALLLVYVCPGVAHAETLAEVWHSAPPLAAFSTVC